MIGCSSLKIEHNTKDTINTYLTNNFFSGLLVINPKTGDTISSYNNTKYFTPASNAKIFTLYVAQKILPKKTPILKYRIYKDTTFIHGTGDPTFLHPYFKDSTIVNFLKPHKNIVLSLNNYSGKRYGAGWAWDDYDAYYAAEINSFPIYGNIVTIDSNKVIPNYFKDSIFFSKTKKKRERNKNLFYIDSTYKKTTKIPFITHKSLIKELLENRLGKEIKLTNKTPHEDYKTLYGIPTDSLYKRMMHESDNFIAEQLLLIISSTLSDTLSSFNARNYALKTLFKDIKQVPRWVDGSGLSRYNLCTPESIVDLLHKIYNETPREQLFNIFPAGGVSGTIKHNFKGKVNPYIYAKSGSLSNNYCLSGYLITKKGETLIFSFMNNHFKEPTSTIKNKMEIVLKAIRDTY